MFQFRQFSIDDSASAMKIGTDGVMLGAWAFKNFNPHHIIDAGSGSGLIALMLAQRFPEAKITAVEIDSEAADQARHNIAASPWSDRIMVINTDFLEYDPPTEVDAIISNPPYFDEPLPSPDARRATARHESGLTLEKLIDRASKLLPVTGRFAFIAPAHRSSQLIYHTTLRHLDTEHITSVYSANCMPPIRVMIQACKGIADSYINDRIDIRHNGHYTETYRLLTQSFYLPQTFK